MATNWPVGLPRSWEAIPLRAIASYATSNVDKHVRERENAVRLCNYVDVYHNELITPHLSLMSATASPDEITRFGVKAGDVLITKDSESWDDIGVPALVTETSADMVCGYHLALIRPSRDRIEPRFLFRCLQARPVQVQLELAARGITRFGIPKDEIGSLKLPIPPVECQRVIADYLDRETARIDALITAKERLLKLLAERREAVVAHAVASSDGTYQPLRVIARYRVSTVDKLATDEERPIRLCNYADVYRNEFITPEADYMAATASDQEIMSFGLRAGDVIITKDSESWDDIGVPALVIRANEDLVCGYHLALIRPFADKVWPAFLFRCLQASPVRVQLELAARGVTRFGIPKQDIGALRLPVPPIPEQKSIAECLDQATQAIDSLTASAETSINLLKERRAALISAAVTGQVDLDSA